MGEPKKLQYLPVFLSEVEEQLSSIMTNMQELREEPSSKEPVNLIFRYLHTIKGNSGSCGLKNVSKLTHSIENIFGAIRDGKIEFVEKIEKTAIDGMLLLKDSIEKVKEDPDSDDAMDYNDYKNHVDAALKGEESTVSPKSKYKIAERITFTDQEILEYKREYKNTKCKKITVVFDKSDAMADIKMFQFIMAIEDEGVKILKMLPPREFLGKEDFSPEMCKFTLEFILSNLPQTEIAIKKTIEVNSVFLQDYSINICDIRDFSQKKGKNETTINLPEKYLTLVIIKKNNQILAYVCLSIIKIVEYSNNVFWIPQNKKMGLMRYLDRAVPLIKDEAEKVTEKILLINSGKTNIIGIFFDEIIDVKKISPSEIVVDLNQNSMIYISGEQKYKIIEANSLV